MAGRAETGGLSYRRCAFCDKHANTDEHLWPNWARGQLPEKGAYELPIVQRYIGDLAPPAKPPRRRQAGLRSFRPRVVCRSCNGGWMSALETEAKPIFECVINGQKHWIDHATAKTLAKWMFMKSVVMDHKAPQNRAIPTEDAHEFRKTGKIPEYFDIWISKCGEEPWDLCFTQYTTNFPGVRAITQKCGLFNFRVLAIGFKELYLFAMCNRSKLIDLKLEPHSPGTRIYPTLESEFEWPAHTMNAAEASGHVDSLRTMIETPAFASMMKKTAYEHGIVTMEELEADQAESRRHGYFVDGV